MLVRKKTLMVTLLLIALIFPQSVMATTFDSTISGSSTFTVTLSDAPVVAGGSFPGQNRLGGHDLCPIILGDHIYESQSFVTGTSGSHTMETLLPSSGLDTFIALYSPSFDPSNPAANLIVCDDDGGSQWPLSRITDNLAAGTNYEVVVTTWDADTSVRGTINWQILPDITLVQNVQRVPTINEWGMIIFLILAGVVSVYYLRRKKITG